MQWTNAPTLKIFLPVALMLAIFSFIVLWGSSKRRREWDKSVLATMPIIRRELSIENEFASLERYIGQLRPKEPSPDDYAMSSGQKKASRTLIVGDRDFTNNVLIPNILLDGACGRNILVVDSGASDRDELLETVYALDGHSIRIISATDDPYSFEVDFLRPCYDFDVATEAARVIVPLADKKIKVAIALLLNSYSNQSAEELHRCLMNKGSLEALYIKAGSRADAVFNTERRMYEWVYRGVVDALKGIERLDTRHMGCEKLWRMSEPEGGPICFYVVLPSDAPGLSRFMVMIILHGLLKSPIPLDNSSIYFPDADSYGLLRAFVDGRYKMPDGEFQVWGTVSSRYVSDHISELKHLFTNFLFSGDSATSEIFNFMDSLENSKPRFQHRPLPGRESPHAAFYISPNARPIELVCPPWEQFSNDFQPFPNHEIEIAEDVVASSATEIQTNSEIESAPYSTPDNSPTMPATDEVNEENLRVEQSEPSVEIVPHDADILLEGCNINQADLQNIKTYLDQQVDDIMLWRNGLEYEPEEQPKILYQPRTIAVRREALDDATAAWLCKNRARVKHSSFVRGKRIEALMFAPYLLHNEKLEHFRAEIIESAQNPSSNGVAICFPKKIYITSDILGEFVGSLADYSESRPRVGTSRPRYREVLIDDLPNQMICEFLEALACDKALTMSQAWRHYGLWSVDLIGRITREPSLSTTRDSSLPKLSRFVIASPEVRERSPRQLQHLAGVAEMRRLLDAQTAEWTDQADWDGKTRPDGIWRHPDGRRVAIEFDIGYRHQYIRDKLDALYGDYDHVIWGCPTLELVDARRPLLEESEISYEILLADPL